VAIADKRTDRQSEGGPSVKRSVFDQALCMAGGAAVVAAGIVTALADFFLAADFRFGPV
jgi:hypothetical protein